MPQFDDLSAQERLVSFALANRAELLACAFDVTKLQNDAEDVVQELFLILTRFDGVYPQNPMAWLKQVVKRRALDSLRRRVDRALLDDRDRSQLSRSYSDRDLIEEALLRLKEPYQSAIRLRYLEGQEFPELAIALDCGERTARTWVSRGLQLLRRSLKGRRS